MREISSNTMQVKAGLSARIAMWEGKKNDQPQKASNKSSQSKPLHATNTKEVYSKTKDIFSKSKESSYYNNDKTDFNKYNIHTSNNQQITNTAITTSDIFQENSTAKQRTKSSSDSAEDIADLISDDNEEHVVDFLTDNTAQNVQFICDGQRQEDEFIRDNCNEMELEQHCDILEGKNELISSTIKKMETNSYKSVLEPPHSPTAWDYQVCAHPVYYCIFICARLENMFSYLQ